MNGKEAMADRGGFERTFERYILAGFRPYLWIAVIGFVLYWRALSFGFTYLDDNVLIMGNQEFLRNIGNIFQAFFQKVFPQSFLPYYRPMLMISFILDAQLGAAAPLVYHVTNLFIHITASSLVVVLLAKMGYDRWQSFAAGVIYVVHPVLSQAAAWIPGRNDSLLAVFIFASFIFCADFVRGRRWGACAGHVIFFALAIYTKESAIVLVPLCVLYLHLIAKERMLSFNERVLLPGWIVVVALWSWTRSLAIAGAAEVTVFDIGSLVVVYLPAAVQFTGKIFFPFNLSVFPIIQDTSFLYGTAALVILAAAIVFTKEKRYRFIFFGLAWAAGFMLPNLARANYRISADFLEHRVYVTIVGFIMVLYETGPIKRLCRNRKAFVGVTAAVAIIFSSLAAVHTEHFRDRASFWTNAVRTSPHAPFARLALAMEYFDRGRYDDAERELKECLALEPLKADALYHLGKVYFKKRMYDRAVVEYRKAIAVYPYYDGAYLDLGVAYYKQGKKESAEKMWEKTLRLNPRDVSAHKFLAIYYHDEGDYGRSAGHIRALQAMGVEAPADFLKSLEAALSSDNGDGA